MKTQEQIKTYLQDLDGDTLKRVWNDYCYTNSLDDNNIYDMDEFDDIMSDSTPTDIPNAFFTAILNLATTILILMVAEISHHLTISKNL